VDSPQSRGTIRLASADPFEPPLINPAYLSSQNDVRVLVRATRIVCKIGAALIASGHVCRDLNPALDTKLHERSDEELEKVVRERVETLYHPACTAKMGKREEGGVVDARLKVYGVRGLRVADASVMPRLVAGHTVSIIPDDKVLRR
jgi:choline dehydrogenase